MSALILPVVADRHAKGPKSVVVYGGTATSMPDDTIAGLMRLWDLRKTRLIAHVRPVDYLRHDVLIMTAERPMAAAMQRMRVIHVEAALCALRAARRTEGGAA